MRNMKKICILGLLAAALCACDPHLPTPNVLPNPVMEKNGLQRLSTIRIYEEHDIQIPVSRVYGISKELHLALELAPDILKSYNEIYSSSYEQLDPAYYELQESVILGEGVKTGTIPVKIYTKKLIADKGVEGATKYILPLRMTCLNYEIKDPGAMGEIMVCLSIDDPRITISGSESHLSFTPLSSDTQNVTLSAQSNFTTLAAGKVTYVADESRVSEYNAAHGTSYELLPEGKYTVCPTEFDAESCALSTQVVLDCASLGTEGQYLLPLVLSQKEGYDVAQNGVDYVVVDMTSFQLWFDSADRVREVDGNEGKVTVNTNAPVDEDLIVSLLYHPASVDSYNASHGTNFISLETYRISTEPVVLLSGQTSVEVPYTVDVDNLAFANYALCFEIDLRTLPTGAEVREDSSLAMFKVSRSIAGSYDVTANANGKFKDGPHTGTLEYNSGWRQMAGEVYLAADNHKTEYNNYEVLDNQYSVTYSDKWADGIAFFDVSPEQMPDRPGCYAIINLRDRYNSSHEDIGFSEDPVTYNDSYIDSRDGSIHWDFVIDNGNTAYEICFVFTKKIE